VRRTHDRKFFLRCFSYRPVTAPRLEPA